MPLSENTSREESTETSKKRKCLAKDSKIRETPVETHSHGEDAVVLDARQKKKRKKKGHVQHDLSVQMPTKVSEAASSAKSIDIQESSTKKKKQKKKKNKRQKAHDRQSDEHENKSISDGRPVSPVLEGSMVDGMLVLIDRKAGKVYSSTAQDCNGNRIVVGILEKQVGIKLTRRNDTTNSAEDECKNQETLNSTNAETSRTTDPNFPYETDPDDHCESPLEAYKDIVALLQNHAGQLYGKTPAAQQKLAIYDPYYCNGRVVSHLENLGFPNVYNCMEDCYQVWQDSARYPKYNILMTNPPYSGDHVEKLLTHVTSKQVANKPWMLLMPSFVHKKDYFHRLMATTGQHPIYLVPHKRYIYQPPANFRDKKASDTHKKSSPFVSMWYLWGGSQKVTDEWFRLLQQEANKRNIQGGNGFDVARSKSGLRDLRRKPKSKRK